MVPSNEDPRKVVALLKESSFLPIGGIIALGCAFIACILLFLALRRIRTGTVTKRVQILACLAIANISLNLGRTTEVELGPGFEPLAIAQSLASGNGFANPFPTGATGPTAHCAPLYPALLATELHLFGYGEAFALSAIAMTLFFQLVTIACLPFMAAKVFGDERTGYVAGILLIPLNKPMPELDTAISAALCAATSVAVISGRANWSGILSGLMGLTNPSLLPGIASGMATRFSKRQLLAIGGLVLLICGPWVVRTHKVLGMWAPIRDNFGLELWVYNAEGKEPFRGYAHPDTSSAAAKAMMELGEAEYDRRMFSSAVKWISHNAGSFGRLTLHRIVHFWFADPFRTSITCLCLAGMFFCPKAARHSLAGLLVLYPLPYYLTTTAPRYTLPIAWVTALFAGQVLLLAWDKIVPPFIPVASAKFCSGRERPGLL